MIKYKLWKPSEEVLCAPLLAMDTETELIVDHNIPDVVLLQVYDGKSVQLVNWQNIPAYLEECAVWNAEHVFIFHNAAYDLAVLGYPDFLIKAADKSRVVDTMFRFSLFKIAQKGFLTQRSLKFACKEMLEIDIEKEDDIRLTFSRAKEPNKSQLDYAALDPVHTYNLAAAIQAQPTEDIQVRGAIALDYISRIGMLIDETRRKELEEAFNKEIVTHLQVMEDNGYIPGESGNKKILQDYLYMLEKHYEIELPRTPKTKAIKTSDASMEELGEAYLKDRFLQAYKKYVHINKISKTYLKTSVIGSDGRVHTRFNPLVITGRTSSGGPNLQNLPKGEGIRGIFIPTPGYYFAAVDYSQIELCTLAQSIIKWQGKSVLADKINEGLDCHRYLASKVFKKDMKSITKKERGFAKIANFGYPGGLSAETFVPYAKGYGMDLTYAESKDLRDGWLKAFPEMKDYLNPERQPSNPSRYLGRTITGRLRANCVYTEACNNPFQGLAADGGKEALWNMFLQRIRMVDFIHDETLNEIKITNPKTITEEVEQIEDTMIKAMEKVVPDVAIRVESALMDRWYKEAEDQRDDNSYLKLWQPEGE